MEAIILAGGFGTRLQSVVSDLPKCMAAIAGRPFLEYLLDELQKWDFRHIILSVGYKRESIIGHFGLNYKAIKISYAIEEEALGTGGGIMKALEQTSDDVVFAMNGDTLFKVPLPEMFAFHLNMKAKISLALRRLSDIKRFGTVEVNNENRITGFAEKDQKTGAGYVNGGIYCLDRNFMLHQDFPAKFSIEKDFFEKEYGSGHFFGFMSEAYFLDIGIPEDYEKAQYEFTRF